MCACMYVCVCAYTYTHTHTYSWSKYMFVCPVMSVMCVMEEEEEEALGLTTYCGRVVRVCDMQGMLLPTGRQPTS